MFLKFACYFFLVLYILPVFCGKRDPLPIQFSLSSTKHVNTIPKKDRDFAYIIPGVFETYIYEDEKEYMDDYSRSYFALSRDKAGNDCLRHWEIIASGCIPFLYRNLYNYKGMDLPFLPRKIIEEAMCLEGVHLDFKKNRPYGWIDHKVFNKKRYFELLSDLIDYANSYLTSDKIAKYVLDEIGYSGNGKVLYLTENQFPDYMRDSLLIGLKEYIGEKCIDYPKISHVYKSCSNQQKRSLRGRGFNFSQIVKDSKVDRSNIKERIKKHEFEFIIYGYPHKGLSYYELVKQEYSPEKIVYICGEDRHVCEFIHLPNLFIREYEFALQKR